MKILLQFYLTKKDNDANEKFNLVIRGNFTITNSVAEGDVRVFEDAVLERLFIGDGNKGLNPFLLVPNL